MTYHILPPELPNLSLIRVVRAPKFVAHPRRPSYQIGRLSAEKGRNDTSWNGTKRNEQAKEAKGRPPSKKKNEQTGN
jgi:hypothetical protein